MKNPKSNEHTGSCCPRSPSGLAPSFGEIDEMMMWDPNLRLISSLYLNRSALGPDNAGAGSSNRRLQQTQAQVDEVRHI